MLISVIDFDLFSESPRPTYLTRNVFSNLSSAFYMSRSFDNSIGQVCGLTSLDLISCPHTCAQMHLILSVVERAAAETHQYAIISLLFRQRPGKIDAD
jgi:hypothetical protein